MPNEREVWFLQSEQDAVEIDLPKNIPDSTGFILYPFSPSGSSKPYFIQTNNPVKMPLENIYRSTLSDDQFLRINDLAALRKISKTKEEYCESVEDAVKIIHWGSMQKVVLSRVKRIDGIVTGNPLGTFYELCIKYPAAFVSLVYIPDEVLWITATPEVLVSCIENQIKAVSLAGIKPVGDI